MKKLRSLFLKKKKEIVEKDESLHEKELRFWSTKDVRKWLNCNYFYRTKNNGWFPANHFLYSKEHQKRIMFLYYVFYYHSELSRDVILYNLFSYIYDEDSCLDDYSYTYFSIYEKNFMNVNGRKLLELNTLSMKDELGIEDYDRRRMILKAIKGIGNIINFEVDQKVKKIAEDYVSFDCNLDYIIGCLSIPEMMREFYLNYKLETMKELEKKIITSGDRFIDSNGHHLVSDKSDNENYLQSIIGDTIDRVTSAVSPNLRLPIRIMISEINNFKHSKKESLKKIFSPFIRDMPVPTDDVALFGKNLRKSIFIGDWYFEWQQNSSLCIPKMVLPKSGFSTFSRDTNITTMIKGRSLVEIFDILSKEICRWNRTMIYSEVYKENTSGNSLDFVDSIIKCLGIVDTFCVNKRCSHIIRENRKAPLIYFPTSEFQRVFFLKNDSYSFGTHKEFDIFCKNCVELNAIKFEMDFKTEINILQCFDRVFWIRFISTKKEMFKPYDCIFSDPRHTIINLYRDIFY